MKKHTFAIVSACAGILSLAASAYMKPKDYAAQFGGDPDVYIQILSMIDCSALEQEHNLARIKCEELERGSPEFRAEVGYMLAATDRLIQLGCHNAGLQKLRIRDS